jgi:uncharacterized membrane protein
MTGTALRLPRLERLLAGLLKVGSWVASTVIATGIALTSVDSRSGTRVVTIGIALFILLPSVRVLLMLIVFARERDYRYSIIAALVLTIILLAFILGVRTAGTGHGRTSLAG